MAYVTPPTFVAGTVLTAADLNILGDDIVYLKGITDGVTFSGAQLSRSTDQSVSDSTYTNITWTAETFDYGGWWSSGTAITVPAGAIPSGYTTIAVLVFAAVRFASNATGARRIRVMKNGVDQGTRTTGALSGDTTDVTITDALTVASGDTIALQAYQTSGVAINASACSITVLRYAPAA